MSNIAIFASGSGTNAENIIKYFSGNNMVNVALIATENPGAYVLERAKKLGIDSLIFSMNQMRNGTLLKSLVDKQVDFIVLAGFLKLVPDDITSAYKNRIVNIHPALLPKYGGKGMFGNRVHEAVVANGEKESGITIHYVNGVYDSGDIIYQAKCQVLPDDTADSLAKRVHGLEYVYYPKILELLLCR